MLERSIKAGLILVCLAVVSVEASAAGMSADEIRARLLDEVSVNFVDTPFESAVRYLQKKIQVNIVLDRTTVDERRLRTPVVFQIKGIPAGEVLDWLTRMADLHYEVRDQTIVVSTKADLLRKRVDLKIYDVRDLTRAFADFPGPDLQLQVAGAAARGATPGLVLIGEEMWEECTVQSLAEMIQQRVRPGEWAAELGTSIEERGGKLVVMQSKECHQEIEALLATLRERFGRMIHFTVRLLRVPRDRKAELLADSPTGALWGENVRAVDALVAAEPERLLASTGFTCFNAQRMHSIGGNAGGFVGDYEITGEAHDPIIERVVRGLCAEVRPILSDKGDSMILETRLTYTWLVDAGKDAAFRPLGNEDGTPYISAQPGVIQQPRLASVVARTTVLIANGATVAISAGRNGSDLYEDEDLVFLVTPKTVTF